MKTFSKFFTLLLFLTSCSHDPSSSIHKYEYSDVSDRIIPYTDVFKQEGDEYYIYYYQENCYHCHGIKSKIISYALKNDTPFFFIKIEEDYGFLSHSKEETIGTNDPLKAFSLMTPQLSKVKDEIIIETYIGNEEILNVIEY